MTQPLTTGEKNRRANIRAQKAIGVRNAKTRQATAVANYLAHLDAMNQRSVDAATARAVRRLQGLSVRDAHNADLRDAAALRRGQDAKAATDGEINAAPTAANDGAQLPLAA